MRGRSPFCKIWKSGGGRRDSKCQVPEVGWSLVILEQTEEWGARWSVMGYADSG